MASEEHKSLAAYIKKVHHTLRLLSREVGQDQAWLEHRKLTCVLEKYAESMQKLATEFWEPNTSKDNDLSRILWVVTQSEMYFYNGGCEKAAVKEDRLSKNYFQTSTEVKVKDFSKTDVLKLLDVGSCYNPFSKYELFDVTAVDLMPATSGVLKCDFLTVEIDRNLKLFDNECVNLPTSHFDIVVFSLLLEYFPASTQRFRCCEKAFRVLCPGGILFILTPDSKHATANSCVMKSWRYALASIGFLRVSYQKQKHLHCMAYRKCYNIDVAKEWFSRKKCDKKPEELVYIPQDFNEYDDRPGEDQILEERSATDNERLAANFCELPSLDLF